MRKEIICGVYVKNVLRSEETRDDLCLYVKSFLRSEEKGMMIYLCVYVKNFLCSPERG